MQHISKQRIQKIKQIKTTAKDSNKNQSNSYFCLTQKKQTNNKFQNQNPKSQSKRKERTNNKNT